MSLRDLARRLGVSGAYLSRVENGLDAEPTPARLEAISRELGVPATLLIGMAHRISPLVADYVDLVPESGMLFLDVARRKLRPSEIAEVFEFLDKRFPRAAAPSVRSLSELLKPSRIVLRLSCSDISDVLDLAASRLAEASSAGGVPAMVAALRKRESAGCNAIGGGVAVTGARVANAPAAAVLVTLESPLPYATPDHEPLQIVIALTGAPGARDHLPRLARIARLADLGLADQLAGIDSPAKALARLVLLEALP